MGVPRIDEARVLTSAANHDVVPVRLAGVQHVVSRTSAQLVMELPATHERVSPTATQQDVSPLAPVHVVFAVATLQPVVPGSAEEEVVVPAAADAIVPRASVDLIVTSKA